MFDDFELLSTDDLLSLPPQQWLLKNIIPKEGFTAIWGAPSTQKSFVALDWSMCISEGMPWQGQPTKRAPVIYVAAEGGRGIQKRVRAWMDFYQKKSLPGMHWLLNPLYVREEGMVERFVEKLAHMDVWPGLLVLDTLARSFGGGDENASTDMGYFVQRMTDLSRERRMAVLVIHHANATGTRERGNTNLLGGLDTMWRCIATRDKATNHIQTVEVRCTKQKDDIEPDPFFLKPEFIGRSLVLVKAEKPAPPERGSQVPGFMRKIDMVTMLGAAEHGYTADEWRLACQMPKTTFYRRLNQLRKEGTIYQDSSKRYFVTPATEDLAALED